MFSEIARVFSSQGMPVGRAGYAYAYGSKAPENLRSQADLQAQNSESESSFGAHFDQASAKLELSTQSQEMAKRDRQVRAHEQAHLASAGGVAKGGANFEYQIGADGKAYAVGGHVKIDSSPVNGNPEATLQKAEKIKQAALAPSDPSGQDRAVAVAAANMALEAKHEIAGKMATDTNSSIKPGVQSNNPYSRSSNPTGKSLSVYA
jgi:SprA-related family